MQLILDTKDLKLLRKRASFLVEPPEGKGKPRTISPKKLSSIAITQKVLLSSDAIELAIQNEIPILFFDRIGKAQARLWSPYFGSIATLRRQQVHFAESEQATQWIIRLFELKMDEQIRNLMLLSSRFPSRGEELEKSIVSLRIQHKQMGKLGDKTIGQVRQAVMGNEGAMARSYWQALGRTLPAPYGFNKRSRRPAEDIFNAGINYLYGMLYSVVEGALFAAGLDPHLGILHADEYNKPVLAFDLIEPFRPWLDRLLIEQCLDQTLEQAFVSKNQYGLFLNKKGKAFIIPLFNDYLRVTKRYQGKDTTVKNHIYSIAAKLAQRIRTLDKGIDLDEIDPDYFEEGDDNR